MDELTAASAVLLVRHAAAGNPAKWEGPDSLRPLSEKGRRQAAALVDTLAGYDIGRVMSSPYLRCIQTVEPLAQARGLPIEETQALAEGAGHREVAALLDELGGTSAVLCTHGDVAGVALDLVADEGVDTGDDARCAKGSVWVVETDHAGDHFVAARYLPPSR
ncbi:MAG: SixA phosphatase family protein [Acidimicrobiales bacterium]